MISLENSGLPYFYREVDYIAHDFERLPNGYYSYAQRYRNSPLRVHKILNIDFEEVDTVLMGNGYLNDPPTTACPAIVLSALRCPIGPLGPHHSLFTIA